MRQATAVETGNTRIAKIINTTNIIHNGGEKLEPEFKEYIGDILAEEEFEASQPGKPIVRRDQEAETSKLRRSNHCSWVSSRKLPSHPCTDSLYVGWHRAFADSGHGQYGLHGDADLRRR